MPAYVFQARGLINARVIQYNLDWVWPYWVHRQFGPEDPSFVPRSFSLGHVNLTQRSWTAVGRRDIPVYAIVDPRGLVTPLYDSWSLDFWVIDDQGDALLPSLQLEAHQQVALTPHFTVSTRVDQGRQLLQSEVSLRMNGTAPMLRMAVTGRSPKRGWLVVSVRPYNPRGHQFCGRFILSCRSDITAGKQADVRGYETDHPIDCIFPIFIRAMSTSGCSRTIGTVTIFIAVLVWRRRRRCSDSSMENRKQCV